MRFARTLTAFVGLAAPAATPIAVASYDGGVGRVLTQEHGLTHEHADHTTQAYRATRADVRQVRRKATARFHTIANAESAGYVLLKDLQGITCIDMPGLGGMGVHYVKPALIVNPAIRASAPEALVYAPDRDGTLRLAALEFLVDKASWDAGHSRRPSLLRGHGFAFNTAPGQAARPPDTGTERA